MSEYLESETIKLYQSGLSCSQVAKKVGMSKAYVQQMMRKYNVKAREHTFACRKYNLNEHYFDSIDSQEKAYFLGFLFADGCNYAKQNKISLGLKAEDKYMLEKFKDLISYNGPIHVKRKDKYPAFQLILGNKYLCEQLNKLGCTPQKSLTLKFPDYLQDNMIPYFIRGYFDGDGSLSGCKNQKTIQVIGTTEFLSYIKNILDNKNVCKCTLYHYGHEHPLSYNVWYLQVGGNRQTIKFLDWIYKDSTIHLERKYKRYLDLKSYLTNMDATQYKNGKPMVERKCSVEGCLESFCAKDYCKQHYHEFVEKPKLMYTI